MNNELFNIESSKYLGKRNRDETFILNSNNKKQKLLKELREPNIYEDIVNLNDKNKWLKSVDNELNNMRNLRVYETIDKIPNNANLISSRWIFKFKRNSQGEIIKRKSRLVAKGFTQEYVRDYKKNLCIYLKAGLNKNLYSDCYSEQFRNKSNKYNRRLFKC